MSEHEQTFESQIPGVNTHSVRAAFKDLFHGCITGQVNHCLAY